jgi:hypothetical protein
MDAATSWGFDENAWHAKPVRGDMPPFDAGTSKDVVITDQRSPEDCLVEGRVPCLSYMRAALAAHVVGVTKAGEQAAMGLVKRVLGFMVSRNLCSNPYRYMMLDTTMNNLLFDGLMQLLTLVTHSDNDVRAFYHLTENATLTKVSTTCMLKPMHTQEMTAAGPGGAMAVLFRDVHHFHFGGTVISQPTVGKVFEWHMYRNMYGAAESGSVSVPVPVTVTVTVTVPVPLKKGMGFVVQANIGTVADDKDDVVQTTLPDMTYIHNVKIEGPGGFVPVTSLVCSTFFAVTRFGDNFATMTAAAQKASFAKMVCLTARTPTLCDVFTVIRAPQLIFTRNLQEDFAAFSRLDDLQAAIDAVRKKLQTHSGDIDPATLVRDFS